VTADPSLLSLLSFGDGGYGGQLLDAFVLTVEISACSYALALLFGLAGARLKLARGRVPRLLGGLYTATIRALPELLLLLIAFFAGTALLASALQALGFAGDAIELDPFVVAVTALGFIQGAYMTEALRAGFQAVPPGQLEAARALGMGRWLVLRRIALPLALRHALPAMGNIWLNATKDSALVSVLGAFADILKASSLAAAATKHYLFFYTVAAGAFLLLSLVSLILLDVLERRASRGLRKPA
jgi:octopine/nopaline transport system permease protein